METVHGHLAMDKISAGCRRPQSLEGNHQSNLLTHSQSSTFQVSLACICHLVFNHPFPFPWYIHSYIRPQHFRQYDCVLHLSSHARTGSIVSVSFWKPAPVSLSLECVRSWSCLYVLLHTSTVSLVLLAATWYLFGGNWSDNDVDGVMGVLNRIKFKDRWQRQWCNPTELVQGEVTENRKKKTREVGCHEQGWKIIIT